MSGVYRGFSTFHQADHSIKLSNASLLKNATDEPTNLEIFTDSHKRRSDMTQPVGKWASHQNDLQGGGRRNSIMKKGMGKSLILNSNSQHQIEQTMP